MLKIPKIKEHNNKIAISKPLRKLPVYNQVVTISKFKLPKLSLYEFKLSLKCALLIAYYYRMKFSKKLTQLLKNCMHSN